MPRPKGKKAVCPQCGKEKRSCNFKKNRVVQKKVCGPCDKKIGHNPFYEDPKIHGAKNRSRRQNYNIKFDESQALYREFRSKGMSHEDAAAKVKNRRRYINWFQWKKRREEQKKDEGNKNIMRNLLKGLRE